MLAFLSAAPACDAFLDFSSAAALMCLWKTCRTVQSVVDDYIARRFCIKTFIRFFFANNTRFRELMASEGCILSGINVLLFMARGEVIESLPLDIVVDWKSARNVCNWLLEESEPRFFLAYDTKQVEGIFASFSAYDRCGADMDSRGLSDKAFTERFGFCPKLKFRSRSSGTIIRVFLTKNTPVEKIISQSSSKF